MNLAVAAKSLCVHEFPKQLHAKTMLVSYRQQMDECWGCRSRHGPLNNYPEIHDLSLQSRAYLEITASQFIRRRISLSLASPSATLLWIQTATSDRLWVGRSEYTFVWPSSVVKCPCPSHLMHLWQLTHVNSQSHHLFSEYLNFSKLQYRLLRIHHVYSLSLLRCCSCLAWPGHAGSPMQTVLCVKFFADAYYY